MQVFGKHFPRLPAEGQRNSQKVYLRGMRTNDVQQQFPMLLQACQVAAAQVQYGLAKPLKARNLENGTRCRTAPRYLVS